MEKQIFSDFIDKYRDAEMVVIGIGEEWNAYIEKQEYQDLLAFYAPYLEKKKGITLFNPGAVLEMIME